MTLTARLAAYFAERPNQWIDGRELATIAGAYAWRSRVSDVRRSGLTIENGQVKRDGYTFSYYRYVPKLTQAQR